MLNNQSKSFIPRFYIRTISILQHRMLPPFGEGFARLDPDPRLQPVHFLL